MNFKINVLAFALIFTSTMLLGQGDPSALSRLDFDPNLGPFYHGVASGDPLPDAVIIWTRVTTEESGDVTVSWKMATDPMLNNIVKSGNATASASRDHTIKVDVTGLQPATYYYYQFEGNGRKSLVGRTKTAPTGDANHLRFAVVSCADYENGYFNAYEHIAYRNDIDAVIHLGDYIYEYAVRGLTGSGDTIPGRHNVPDKEIITLDDYRLRHSHYRLDNQLRMVHQQYPFITTWDDHETANNSWYGGADNHNPNTEGDWFVRKANGKQAYFEWLPVRESTVDPFRVYRKIRYSNLADLIILDTRLEGRDKQDGVNNLDTTRTILGHEQYNWLVSNLHDTITQWKIIAQQIMMVDVAETFPLTFFEDFWDGYPAERFKLHKEILDNDIKNFVVLTGDIHTSWANELKLTGLSSVGVEFVTPSITTANADVLTSLGTINLALLLPDVKYSNIVEHGYMVVDIDKDRVQTDWVFVNTIKQLDTSSYVATSWLVYDQQRTLTQASSAAAGLANQASLAPLTVNNPPVGLENNNQASIVVLGSYPNPFWDKFIVQYYLEDHKPVRLQILDNNGRIMLSRNISNNNTGVNYAEIEAPGLPQGNYFLIIDDGSLAYQRSIIKVN